MNKLRSISAIALMALCSAFVAQAQDLLPKIQQIVRETPKPKNFDAERENSQYLIERAKRLEELASRYPSSPGTMTALLLAATTRNDIDSDDPQLEQQDSLQVLKTAQPNSWEAILASELLVGAYHHNGEHDAVIASAEKILKEMPDQRIIDEQMKEVPSVILKAMGADDPKSPLAPYDDARVALAIAYNRRGRHKDALRVYSEITDPECREFLKSEFPDENGKPKG